MCFSCRVSNITFQQSQEAGVKRLASLFFFSSTLHSFCRKEVWKEKDGSKKTQPGGSSMGCSVANSKKNVCYHRAASAAGGSRQHGKKRARVRANERAIGKSAYFSFRRMSVHKGLPNDPALCWTYCINICLFATPTFSYFPNGNSLSFNHGMRKPCPRGHSGSQPAAMVRV
jgi:hypothetical protein